MPFLPWSSEMVIDEGPIDGQHQQLVDGINQLYDQLHAGEAQIAGLLDYLVIYVDIHFADEERLMQLSGYPDLEGHRDEHRLFTAQLDALSRAYHRGEAKVDQKLMEFLKAWLINHIMGTDRDYAPAIRAWRAKTQITEADLVIDGL
jgi:hemerythrin-like metal-binding protein